MIPTARAPSGLMDAIVSSPSGCLRDVDTEKTREPQPSHPSLVPLESHPRCRRRRPGSRESTVDSLRTWLRFHLHRAKYHACGPVELSLSPPRIEQDLCPAYK